MLNNLVKILISLLLVIDIYALIFLKIDPNSLFPSWTKASEGTTELFFVNHLSLPKRIELQETYNFEFIVHNLESKDLNYSYTVVVNLNNQNWIINEGTFVLKHDESRTVPVTFLVNESFQRAKVTVTLSHKNQEIAFWMEEIS